MATPQISSKSVLYAVVVLIVIGLLVFVLPGQMPRGDTDFPSTSNNQNTNTNNNPTTEQIVVQELAGFQEIKPFVSYQTSVKLLSESQLSSLRSQQPAIYGDAPVNSYEVDYDGKPIGKDNGLLVIYDHANKKILKMFLVQDFTV